MIRIVVIAATLFAFWLLLSGNYKAWLVASGAGTAILVVIYSRWKRIIDPEGFPAELLPRAVFYWPWLLWQIVLSALNVSRIILDPKLPISPTMVRVAAKPRTPVGIVTYANSITLTPGTISVEVAEREGKVWVHAITKENAEGLEEDEMNARVAEMEGAGRPGEAA